MSNTKTSHPYADVIKAWADGERVQYKSKAKSDWSDIEGNEPSFNNVLEGRIKPEPQQVEQPNCFEQFKTICKGIADGRTIQYRAKGYAQWLDDNNLMGSYNCYMFDFSQFEFRLKPNTKIISYQNYKKKFSRGIAVCAWCVTDGISKKDIEGMGSFIEWIGEEQFINIEVEDDN